MAEKDFKLIENLKRKMYSRGVENQSGIREHRLPPSEDAVKGDWGKAEFIRSEEPAKGLSGLKIFLIFSVLFFIAAISYAFYFYFGGANVVSPQNIGIAIAGPVSIRGGEKLSLEVSVENGNSTLLEVADMLVEYPEGTRNPADISKELLRSRDALGDITPGSVVKRTVSAVLFGEENSIKNIKVTVEYRVPGSNAIFYKESEYQVVISSAPLSIVAETPTEATSGQDLSIKVTIQSNSTDVVKGVLFRAEYPAGFSFKSADPKPFAEDRVWKMGDIKPGSSRTFVIRGSLSGEDSDARVFRFYTGIASLRDDKIIGTPFANIQEEISIKKPFVGLSLAIDGSHDENVSTKSGKPVRVDITYTNNLLVPVSDIEISIGLQGAALEKTSVSAERGFYRSVDDIVIWNKSTLQSLSLIPPGESGTVSVTLASKTLSSGIANLRNPEILLSASVKGRRVESGRVPEEVVDSLKRSVRIQSDVALNARILYFSGPLKNSGPIPPKAERETTYTAIATVTNGSNDLGDALVTIPLPAYVRFVGAESSESVSFSEVGGVVAWNLGSVKAGTGFGTPPREAVFQIAFIPSISQVGGTPVLLNDMSLSSVDRFTGSSISVEKSALNTRLTSDAGAKQGDDVVVK